MLGTLSDKLEKLLSGLPQEEAEKARAQLAQA
jgi:hypothetical protein